MKCKVEREVILKEVQLIIGWWNILQPQENFSTLVLMYLNFPL